MCSKPQATTEKAMQRQHRLTLLAGAIALGLSAAHAAPATDAADAAATAVKQPWRNASETPENRAAQLLAAMTFEQKVALVNGADPGDYATLAPLGIPALTRVDASGGLRGDRGVTAFPVPLALAATFDPALAGAYGQAIGEEARAKGWNVILGPTVDIARDPRSGRLPEAYGEEPLLSAELGTAVTKGMQGAHLIAMGKHVSAYQTERDRLSMNVNLDERTLREVYNYPFDALVKQGHIASLMSAYPKVNGTFAVENKELIDLIKVGDDFRGYFATDFMGGADGVAQINAGIDSWSLEPFLRRPDAFADGRISAQRLDDAARRMLWSLFATGLFDHPVTTAPASTVTTPKHQALALKTAEASIVLLKNEGGLLPLARHGRVAVIGPADRDVVTGVMWSSYVDPGQFEPPIDAISAAAGSKVRVTNAQGSTGDFTLPSFGLNEGDMFAPPVDLATPEGTPGWKAEFWNTPDFAGAPTRQAVDSKIDVTGHPAVGMPDQWSARWTSRFTPTADGLVRLAASVSGTVTVKVDGRPVIDGMRSTATNFPGAGPYTYPLQGTARLKAGQPVTITVEYSTKGAIFGRRMQLGWQPMSKIAEAVKVAKEADVAVVFVNQVSGEEMDRDDLSIPADQDALVEAVSAANPNTVVVLNTGGPVKMPWLPRVKSVLQMWYPGAASGTGIARVLFGDAEPGGRLPVTFPADESQGPKHYAGGGSIDFSEGVFVGYRWFLKNQQKPLFPFGYGLGYTTFGVDHLKVRPLASGEQRTTVSVQVTNTGARSGSTVVQVYGGPLPAAVETPERLIGFARVELAPGKSRVVTIPISRRDVSYWDVASKAWTTPSGTVPVRVGFSSEDAGVRGQMSLR